eukprot:CAMPEP_0185857294 /NCGR_PEP_ID=MMETSP1354-20130828/29430_1 /TAXON_ID=708628 /ORGANISM="Erythrolobus madagascarensis, Strain CCMP3276" /LENGTH=303 /DNA_ID=CAMNT_0028559561 /DNA_START=12 /DNA_END=923 /DNA_ORIENTATION=+
MRGETVAVGARAEQRTQQPQKKGRAEKVFKLLQDLVDSAQSCGYTPQVANKGKPAFASREQPKSEPPAPIPVAPPPPPPPRPIQSSPPPRPRMGANPMRGETVPVGARAEQRMQRPVVYDEWLPFGGQDSSKARREYLVGDLLSETNLVVGRDGLKTVLKMSKRKSGSKRARQYGYDLIMEGVNMSMENIGGERHMFGVTDRGLDGREDKKLAVVMFDKRKRVIMGMGSVEAKVEVVGGRIMRLEGDFKKAVLTEGRNTLALIDTKLLEGRKKYGIRVENAEERDACFVIMLFTAVHHGLTHF